MAIPHDVFIIHAPTIIAVGFAAIMIGCVIYISVSLYDTFENYERPLITSGSNDDADAKDHIKQVVMAAKTSVEIFDDGDKIKEGESVYDDREFLELVDEKLDEGVRFLCLFNSDNPKMAFRERFDNDKRRIDIRVRKMPSSGRSSIHYRNADSGRMIYLTNHQPHSKNRRFKMIDASEMGEEHCRHLDQNLNEWRQNESDFSKVG